MPKQKQKSGVFLMVTLLIGLLFTLILMPNKEVAYAEGSPVKQLKDLNQGDEISFADQEWTVLEPEEGYILIKDSLGRGQFDQEWSTRFDVSREVNIGYYLNTTYYDTLNDEEKEAILPREWGIGHEGDENGGTVEAKIGLLSHSEWSKYSKRHNREAGFLNPPAEDTWLRTPYSASIGHVWGIWAEARGNFNRYQVHSGRAISPALTLNPELFISVENEVILTERVEGEPPFQLPTHIAAAATFTIGLRSDGTVIAKGDNSQAQTNVRNWSNIAQVAANSYHSVGLKEDGSVVAVASGLYGPLDVSGWRDIVQVAAGQLHTAGVKSDGSVVATGYSLHGQTNVDEWEDIIQVAAGAHHTVGLKNDGSVIATGRNNYGQTDAEDWEDIIQIAASGEHTVGLKSDGSVVATGYNLQGQTDVGDWENITQVAAGNSHTVGLKSDGRVIVAGRDPFGFGHTDVKAWENIIQVAASGGHTVGLKSNGRVVATGSNSNGQIELNDWTIKTFAPQPAQRLTAKSAPNAETDVEVSWQPTPDWGIGTAFSRKYELEQWDGEGWIVLDEFSESDTSWQGELPEINQSQLRIRTVTDFHVSDYTESNLFRVGSPASPEITAYPEITNQSAIDISGTAEAGSDVKVTYGDEEKSVSADEKTGEFTIEGVELIPNQENLLEVVTISYGITSDSVQLSILHDDIAPLAPTVELEPNGWTNEEEVLVTITNGEEAGSGVARTEYRIGEEAWKTYEEAFTITEEGETQVEARTIDQAGNESDMATATVKIDRTDPSITISMTQGDEEADYEHDTWTNQAVHLSVQAEDQVLEDLVIRVNNEEIEDIADFQHVFSISEAGTYAIEVSASDQAGNKAEEERIVKIDQSAPGAPVIELDPEGWTNREKVTVTIEDGEDEANGSGIAATEYRIGETGDWMTYEDPFDVEAEGKTAVYARTIDKAGNTSEGSEAIVRIKRTTPAAPSIEVETSEWTNAASVAVDLTTEEDTAEIVYQLNRTEADEWLTYAGDLVITAEGETTIYARSIDQAGNSSKIVEAVVKIDHTAPELTLLGENPLYILYGETFEEPGYQAEDNFTDDLEVVVTGEVDTNQIGKQELIYAVQDHAGNKTTQTRTVYVVDEDQPVIILKGDNPLILEVGTTYEEAGATAEDNVDGDISDQINITDNMDTAKLGVYQVIYQVEDSSGNQTEVIRTIEVVDTTAPEMTLDGEEEITIELGDDYQEAGAQALDNYDGDLSDRIEITGSVDTSRIGTYQLTYRVADSSNNAVSQIRTIHVTDTTPPTDVIFETTGVTTEHVTFTFSAQDLGGIKNYMLSRDGEEIALIAGDETTYTDNEVRARTTYLYQLTAVDFSDNVSSAVTVKITTKEKPKTGAPITVEYVDEEGNQLADTEEITGKIGEVYETTAKEIEGYQLIQHPENAAGEFTEEAQTVRYIYTPIKEEPLPGALVTVKYVDEQGNELLPAEELNGKIGEPYQTYPSNIAGYELIQTPDNAAGEFTDKAQTVTYVYAPEEGNLEGMIIIAYVDEAGQPIASRETRVGIVGEQYETEPKEIEGYELIQTPENATGKFTEEVQMVTYVYALEKEEPTLGAPVTVKYVDEEDNELIPSEELTGEIGEVYKTEPIQIGGYELIQIPGNAAGEFTNEAQTVIYVYASVEEAVEGTIIIAYVDEAGHAIANRETRLGVVGERYETEPKAIEGYRLIQTPENATGQFTEEIQMVTYVYALEKEEPKQGAPVTVKYIDEAGVELLPAEEWNGNIGESYQTYPANIEGYKLLQTSENAAGEFTNEAQTVIYLYAPVEEAAEAMILIAYVDEAGQPIASRETRLGVVGEQYKTEPKKIEGYQLIQTPENATGTFTEKAQTVTYVYAQEKTIEPKAPETIEIELDQPPLEMFPAITVTIKETQTIIELPADLPEGTRLQVKSVDSLTFEGFQVAGELYDFIFIYPEGKEDYTGEFILTMGVTEASDQAVIYYYQDDSGEWERIGGTREKDLVTATVTHFSIYGVLLAEADSPIPKEETPEPKESGKEEQKQKPKETKKSTQPQTDSKQAADSALPKQTIGSTAVTGAGEQGTGLEQNTEAKTGDLPNTATQQYHWLLAGSILILLSGSIWWFRRNSKQ
ncbi:MucBP domain-containing protein [Gracilibacillus alcaliphilus]|uniref:MucBP domain-containing protein n=1 Tax=Gracilibacillus alcaliphilus TaxID=1401441 RepID=UPI00195BA23D|nr:MucBP domain-containing protein [Gracilibacillus alcaliphilus]MBM7675355.1 hypothetical protein [Gracilibacillus alcaliphilus]